MYPFSPVVLFPQPNRCRTCGASRQTTSSRRTTLPNAYYLRKLFKYRALLKTTELVQKLLTTTHRVGCSKPSGREGERGNAIRVSTHAYRCAAPVSQSNAAVQTRAGANVEPLRACRRPVDDWARAGGLAPELDSTRPAVTRPVLVRSDGRACGTGRTRPPPGSRAPASDDTRQPAAPTSDHGW